MDIFDFFPSGVDTLNLILICKGNLYFVMREKGGVTFMFVIFYYKRVKGFYCCLINEFFCRTWANLTSKYFDSWLCIHSIRIRCKFRCIVKHLIGKLSKQKSSLKNVDRRRRKENFR